MDKQLLHRAVPISSQWKGRCERGGEDEKRRRERRVNRKNDMSSIKNICGKGNE
jgi:hypothetical protein